MGWTVRDRTSVGEAKFSAIVQSGPGVHQVPYKMGAGFFQWVQRPGHGVDHQPPSSVNVKEGDYLCLHALHRCSNVNFISFYYSFFCCIHFIIFFIISFTLFYLRSSPSYFLSVSFTFFQFLKNRTSLITESVFYLGSYLF
jgi:hypothetical protein